MSNKTKAELEADIRDLKRQLADQTKQEQWNKMGEDLYGFYKGLLSAGFSTEHAYELLKISFAKSFR